MNNRVTIYSEVHLKKFLFTS